MTILSCLTRFFLILLPLLGACGNTASAAPANPPRVLLFSAIDSQHLADSLKFWGNDVGVNGFMLSYVAEWWSSKNELARHTEVLAKINAEGKQYDIDSNFIKVALGNDQLPVWTDDKAWAGIIYNFKNIAGLIKQTGMKGIALDTEPYTVALFDSRAPRFKTINRNILKAKVFQRGRETMQALTAVYPDIEVILLPEGAFYWFNPSQGTSPEAFELWIDYYNGMASVRNNKGIIVATERTYSVTSRSSLVNISRMENAAMTEHVDSPVFWKEQGSIAIGLWPVGKEYDNKAAIFSPAEFKQQFAEAASLSPKYIWIYDHGSSWYQLKKSDRDKYIRSGRLLWGRDFQILPTDPNIDAYYSVVRDYKKARQAAR